MPTRLERLLQAGEVRLRALLAAHASRLDDAPRLDVPGRGRAGERAPGLLAGPAGERHLVLLRGIVGNPSFDALRRALAEGLLTGRAAAPAQGAKALPVVVATPLSERMVERLADYLAWSAPDGSWGAVDPHGLVHLQLGDRTIAEPAGGRSGASAPERRASPFTDQGQWLIKVLLGPSVEARWLRVPRGAFRSDADLAGLAGVSASTVSRTLAALEGFGFLERERGGPRLVRVPELLRAWRGAVGSTIVEQETRFRLPGGAPLARLVDALRDRGAAGDRGGAPRLCLGLFAACRQLGLGHVQGAPVHLYHEDPRTDRLAELGLRPVEPGERADVLVRRPVAPEAVFRAAPDAGGVPTSDALQCWLDVFDHPARGREQADELARRLGLDTGSEA